MDHDKLQAAIREHGAAIDAEIAAGTFVQPDFTVTYQDVDAAGCLIPNPHPPRTTWRLVDGQYLKVHTCEPKPRTT